MKNLVVIADWASDSLSRQEFKSAIRGRSAKNEEPEINFVFSQFNVYHTAFLLLQTAITEERLGSPHESVVFVNTDPRYAKTATEEVAKGSNFYILRLMSGLTVCGPNSAYCFSLIKPKIQEMFLYEGISEGSQFRSRDIFIQPIALLMSEDDSEVEKTYKEVSTENILNIRDKIVGHTDNFGNLKTTWKKSDLKEINADSKIKIVINGIEKDVVLSAHFSNQQPGTLAFFPGSSGLMTDPFMEVAVLYNDPYKSAAEIFGYPSPGDKVKVIFQ